MPSLAFENISKRFGGVRALDEVSFQVESGAIHAIVGENGAGKSTLMKIAAGVHPQDGGTVLMDGHPVTIASPRRARDLGIALVPQEPALCPNLTVTENLSLGREPRSFGVLRRGEMLRRAEASLERASLPVSPNALVQDLAPAQRHLLQIARALAEEARFLILDEPTAALSEGEAEHLFDRLRVLKAEGVTILYISHRLPEIFSLCDTITTLRDGRHVATQLRDTVKPEDIVLQMVGRTLAEEEDQTERLIAGSARDAGEAILEAAAISREGAFSNVSFQVRRGEIVTLAGLVGSGRTEVARCIFGLDPLTSGSLRLEGRPYAPRGPQDAIKSGISLVPEDRRHQGLLMQLSVRQNLSLPALASALGELANFGVIRKRAETVLAENMKSSLQIKTSGIEAGVDTLSGGNQQKVVLGKWLATSPKLLIVDEPTQGVDVGAKAQVHALLRDLAAQGYGVLMISSDLPEVLHLSHRILVMRQGSLAGELPHGATGEEVMRLAALGAMAG